MAESEGDFIPGKQETKEDEERRNLSLSLGHHIGTFLLGARLGGYNEVHLEKFKEFIRRLKASKFPEEITSILTALEEKLNSVNVSGEVDLNLVRQINQEHERISFFLH